MEFVMFTQCLYIPLIQCTNRMWTERQISPLMGLVSLHVLADCGIGLRIVSHPCGAPSRAR